MDNIKEAFNKVKQDIEILNKKFDSLSEESNKTRKELFEICDILKEFSSINKKYEEKNISLQEQNKVLIDAINEIPPLIKKSFESFYLTHNPAQQQVIPAHPTHNPADNSLFMAQKADILGISNGNEGVPTDRQTNQQTNQQTDFNYKNEYLEDFTIAPSSIKSSHNMKESSINDAVKILDSLDSIKKDIRLKFKRLTDQELTVFSAIYQLDEENGCSDYKLLSKRLNLTESSIRDYIGRLIKKGIPIEKIKINNKQIQLNISNNLKKIATLNTILHLREL